MEEKIKTEEKVKIDQEGIFAEMMNAGVHYGRAKRFTHPSIKPFLITTNKPIELFNLKFTLEKIEECVKFLKQALDEKKVILFVGTSPASQNKIKEFASAFGQPYLNYKWVGGFLTNFQTIQSRIIYFKELLQKETSGELQNYSPKERSKIERELKKLKNIYSGVINLERLPDIVFIVNLAYKQHKTALKEALKMNIPVVAIAGSDNDVSQVKLFIPGNDKAPKSIGWILDYLKSKLIEKQNNG